MEEGKRTINGEGAAIRQAREGGSQAGRRGGHGMAEANLVPHML
jgi:hypothetical protein